MPRPTPFTDEQLREAVRDSTTLRQVCDRLRLAVGGQTYESLRRGMVRLDLHLAPAQSEVRVRDPRRSWTDDQLRDAVRTSASLIEVCTRLGLMPCARRYEQLRRHLVRLDIDSSHLPTSEVRTRSDRAWTDGELRDVVRDSRSVSEVLRRLGYAPSGGMHRYIRSKIRTLDIDADHFSGQSWSRGRSFPQGNRIRPLEEIMVKGSTYSSGKLRKRLIAAGLKPACCEVCGVHDWRGEPLTLQLDHINGDPTDNRLENLRILCPNCHSQTDTWCRSGRRRGA